MLVLELVWLISPHFGEWGPGVDWYRRKQRMDAFLVWAEHPSSATKAVAMDELQRDMRFREIRGWLIFGLVLASDAAVVYFFWNYGARRTTT